MQRNTKRSIAYLYLLTPYRSCWYFEKNEKALKKQNASLSRKILSPWKQQCRSPFGLRPLLGLCQKSTLRCKDASASFCSTSFSLSPSLWPEKVQLYWLLGCTVFLAQVLSEAYFDLIAWFVLSFSLLHKIGFCSNITRSSFFHYCAYSSKLNFDVLFHYLLSK